MKWIYRLIILTLMVCMQPLTSFADDQAEYYEQVYLTEKQALTLVFQDLQTEKREVTPTKEERKSIQKLLKRKIKDKSFSYFIGKKDNKEMMYAWILDEQGKHFPMTFIVSLNNKAIVDQVAIMVYREKRGDGVKRKRFLNQFKNKGSSDPVEIDTDIVHITGATISSWSIAAGVKKAIILTEKLILKKSENSL